MEAFLMFLFYFCLLFTITISTTTDTIIPTQPMRDSDTIVSSSGKFALGFFSPGSSKNRYIGIWYAKIPIRTYVWVANREVPLSNSSGVLKITNKGILVILNENGSIIWSSNSSRSVRNPVGQLLDSGNLIVKDEGNNDDPENFLWQSFDYPCDTLLPGMKVGSKILPGMKIGRDIRAGVDRYLTSWKTVDDPSPGNFTYRLDLGGYPEFFVKKNLIKQFRLGPWNGLRFSGAPQAPNSPLIKFEFVYNEEMTYMSYLILNTSLLSMSMLTYDGIVLGFEWVERTQRWMPFRVTQIDDCDNYALCGVYSICNFNNAQFCGCLKGFMPRTPREQDAVGWSNGCVRKTPLNCSGDGFLRYSGVKLPETRRSCFNKSMNLDECKNACTKNCSCTAYANLDISDGGSECMLWFDDLIDLREFDENGQDIYIRMAASELDHGDDFKFNVKKRLRSIIVFVLLTGMLLLGLVFFLYVRKKKLDKGKMMIGSFGRSSNDKYQKEDLELPLFDLDTIVSATNDFSNINKLGQGGFGSVYKGTLIDGQEIAVKRLSRSSKQGLDEFKNEVMYITKLQHRNLVKLLGCCIEADEMMLIYEFMPNKSLDLLIFDQTLSAQLNWSTRYQIINGIARGLLYLHQDSRLKIIHRDLKVSNILLDYEMNPKISDFGLARSSGANESQANTKKVVGTFGYMSPEYAIDGYYSVKSDVFSFGVMVLEILSGKRNRGFWHPEHNLNLLGHAWKMYTEGRSSELIAASMKDSCNTSEVLRSIHIGLLCVQRNPEDRPSMSSVVFMLGGEGALPEPKQPGFFTERDIIEDNHSSTCNHKPCSASSLTITLPR